MGWKRHNWNRLFGFITIIISNLWSRYSQKHITTNTHQTKVKHFKILEVLKKEGYTYEEFYEEAKKSIDENNTKVHNNELIPNAFKNFQPSQKRMAEEIHGVILAVSIFQLWADEMREIRRNEMEQLLLDKKK